MRVIYPGLASHPQHTLLKQMSNEGFGFGGIFCMSLETAARANQFMEILQNEDHFGYIAVSLGYFDTLMSASASGASSELSEDNCTAPASRPAWSAFRSATPAAWNSVGSSFPMRWLRWGRCSTKTQDDALGGWHTLHLQQCCATPPAAVRHPGRLPNGERGNAPNAARTSARCSTQYSQAAMSQAIRRASTAIQ